MTSTGVDGLPHLLGVRVALRQVSPHVLKQRVVVEQLIQLG
jgi:hypothetical protein